jgi:hypothetical protein
MYLLFNHWSLTGEELQLRDQWNNSSDGSRREANKYAFVRIQESGSTKGCEYELLVINYFFL